MQSYYWQFQKNKAHVQLNLFLAVLRIRILIRMFLGLLDQDPDPSIMKEKTLIPIVL
jgi:hypothetical protein